MARTSTKAALLNSIDTNQGRHFENTHGVSHKLVSGNNHKRSVSDGNTIFQSLMSNRGAQAMGPSFDNSTMHFPPG